MLVLSRNEGESLTITEGGTTIEVVVIRTGRKVRLGIKAPESVKVMRNELIGQKVDVEA